MTSIKAILSFAAVLMLALPASATAGDSTAATAAKVYKSPACGCCTAWNEHLTQNGFAVSSEEREDIYAIKARLGVSERLASCHTALIEGYVIEGHVPTADIRRLLKERPAGVIGLTAPGMPAKSPGMQAEGLPPKGYDVLAIMKDGTTEVFSRY